MFWKEKKGLRDLSTSAKIAVTSFVILMGISYLFGFLNIYLTYSPVDEKPGLSVQDIKISFYGSREKTVLEKSIDGSMKPNFANDKEYETVKKWIASGGKEKDFAPIKKIFDNSCNSCHSKDAQVAGVVLETYKDVKPLLQQDTGVSVPRLVSLSHVHLFSVASVVFLLVFIFSFTLFSEKVKIAIYSISFLAVALDIGSWWLAKVASGAAFIVIIAGALLALTFALLTLLPLYEMWLSKKAE